jgi:hypothetical protein
VPQRWSLRTRLAVKFLSNFFTLNRLLVSPELKNKLKSKPYDPKKSCWVPNKATHGYDEGLIESTEGDKVTVMILESKEVKYFQL